MIRTLPLALAASFLTLGAYGQAGMLDPSFGTGGIVHTAAGSAGSSGQAVAVRPDGKILLAGGADGAASDDGIIVRYHNDGIVDLTFALNGYSITPNGGSLVWVDMALRPDGKIVVAGVADAAHDDLLARFNDDGSPDLSFGTNGTAVLTYPPVAMLLDPAGNILVVSNTATEHVISRYLENGLPDLTFGTAGAVVNGLGADQATGFGIAMQGSNILLTGGTTAAGEENVAVTRYTSTGAVDPGFGVGGTVATECGSTLESGKAIAVQPDGKIVVGAEFPTGFVVLRYLADGTPDPAFGVDGQVYTFVGANQSFTKDVIVQPDGALLVGGRAFSGTDWAFAVVRYLSDGTLDPSFGTGGITLTFQFGYSYDAQDMALQPDGRLLMGGSRGPFCLARYFTDLAMASPELMNSEGAVQVWPNPSAEDFTLAFDLLREANVRVALLDARGAVLEERALGHLGAGTHQLQWDPKALAVGVYTCRVVADRVVGQVRLMVQR